MENLAFERLWILLLFISLALLNWLLQQVLRRRRPRRPAESQPPPPVIMAERPRSVERKRAARAAPMPVPLPSRSQRRARAVAVRGLLQNKWQVRRAIVLLTVLGPCRGNDPYR